EQNNKKHKSFNGRQQKKKPSASNADDAKKEKAQPTPPLSATANANRSRFGRNKKTSAAPISVSAGRSDYRTRAVGTNCRDQASQCERIFFRGPFSGRTGDARSAGNRSVGAMRCDSGLARDT